jgi:hypothetical protein
MPVVCMATNINDEWLQINGRFVFPLSFREETMLEININLMCPNEV